MALRALIGGPSDDISYVDLIAELGMTMAPVTEEQGVIALGEIDPANFRQRMLAEVARLGEPSGRTLRDRRLVADAVKIEALRPGLVCGVG